MQSDRNNEFDSCFSTAVLQMCIKIICIVWTIFSLQEGSKFDIKYGILELCIAFLWINNTPEDDKNQCIREKTGVQNIVKEIKQYQKKWLQNVQRMDRNRLPRQALKYRPEGRQNVGTGVFRPRQTRQLPRAVDLKGRLLSCQSY